MPVRTNDDTAEQMRRAAERAGQTVDRALHALEDVIAQVLAATARMLNDLAARIQHEGEPAARPTEPADAPTLAAVEQHYRALRADPTAWAKYAAERDLWDRAVGDGLDRA